MKHYLISILLLSSFSLSLLSCKKHSGNDETGFSQEIKNFVPQSIIDPMRKWGLIINEGKVPPDITGIYNFTPNYCTFDNSGYNRSGNKFLDYRFRFRDQNNDKLTISLDYKTLGSATDSAAGVGSFLAGNAGYFTAFVNTSGVSNGITYKQIGFYSGKITSNGIENFQFGFYLTDKGLDPGNKLVKVGSSRIFTDTDKLSTANSLYRVLQPGSSFVSAE